MARALVNKLTEESLCYEEDTLFLEFDPYDKYGDSCVKRKPLFNIEIMQDLQYYHNIDVEAELTAILAVKMQREVNTEIENL